jgi:hypothetical protein
MPGPATRVGMEKNGMPPQVLAALDELKMFDRLQNNDLYQPPDAEHSIETLKLARDEPLAFTKPEQTASAAPAADAIRDVRVKAGGANLT